MKQLIAILTGLHVLAHGVFGCSDHGVAAMALPTAEAAHCCNGHHAHHDTHDAPAAIGCYLVSQQLPAPAPHECAHAACHWLAGGGGTGVGSLEFCGAVAFVAVVPIESSLLLAGQFRPGDGCGQIFAPPLRLHLALGVIVV